MKTAQRGATALALALLSYAPLLAQGETSFQKGDRVAILGNTFAERLQLYGHFEAALLAATPDLELTVRNLAWSADEIALRPRPLNFGTVEDHLEEQQADVALLFYGANESFSGVSGLDAFKVDLARYIERLRTISIDGSAVRLILVSPIPQEQVDRLPDPSSRNQTIDVYREAMLAVALERDVPFVDIFSRVARAMAENEAPLTMNGLHLNQSGDRIVASILVDELGLKAPEIAPFSLDPASEPVLMRPRLLAVADKTIALLQGDQSSSQRYSLVESGKVLATATPEQWRRGIEIESPAIAEAALRLRETVNRKSRLFFDRYRAVNGYYIYGERRNPFGVVSFPPEMKRFDELVAELDRELHQLSRVPKDVIWKWQAEGGN